MKSTAAAAINNSIKILRALPPQNDVLKILYRKNTSTSREGYNFRVTYVKK